VEENFRRALLLSRGNLAVFIERPISAAFIGICTLLVLVQIGFWLRRVMKARAGAIRTDEPFPAGVTEDA
jgi:putative tricarboxylic transport membrane protein